MIISDPDQMERIVSKTRNLIWDGWDVVKISKTPTAMFYKDGLRIKNQWYRTQRYVLGRQGWVLPDEFFKA